MIHHRRNGSRGRIKILDLFGHDPVGLDFEGQLNGIVEVAAGMSGDQVRHQKLFEVEQPVGLLVPCLESLVNFWRRLAHCLERLAADMLRGYLELAADVVLTQFSQKIMLLIHHQIIKPDAGPDKDLFDTWQFTDLTQQGQVITMVSFERGAGFRKEALTVFTDAALALSGTGRLEKVGCRSADIVDITFKTRHFGNQPGFAQDGCIASALDNPPLVESDGTEMAAAKAATMAVDAETDFLDGRYTAGRLIGRMW